MVLMDFVLVAVDFYFWSLKFKSLDSYINTVEAYIESALALGWGRYNDF